MENLTSINYKPCRTELLEIVTRVSYEDADHAILLRELEWLSISQMIEYDSLSLIYKIKNGHAPGHTRHMFEGCEDIHNHNTRSVSSGNFYIKKMNTAKGQPDKVCLLRCNGLE